jgi:hypothetical protein
MGLACRVLREGQCCLHELHYLLKGPLFSPHSSERDPQQDAVKIAAGYC